MISPLEAFKKAVQIAGSQAALARGIGITPWALSKWNLSKINENSENVPEALTKKAKDYYGKAKG